MIEANGIVASAMYTERVMKVRIPVESEEDPLKIFAETRKKFGRKLTIKGIDKLLED
jgi:hypothetical protein